MEQQVYSDTEKTKRFQEKFNKITTFLTKFIFQDNFEALKKTGYVDAFVNDPDITSILNLQENQRLLFLLFRGKKLTIEDLKKIIPSLATIPAEVVFSYELVNNYSMVVIDFPEKYILDYDHVVKGNYSKLSEGFQNRFPVIREVLNDKKQRVAKEYSLYYHIFNKTEWLKEFWLNKLGLYELDEKVELWEKPEEKDLIFNVKTIINDK